jgi:thiol:disulfide interchange protein DsbD
MNFKALLYSFVFLSGFIFGNFQFQEKDILSSDEAFIFKADTRDNKTFLSWQIKPGYYLYKNSVSIETKDNTSKYSFITKNESTISDEFFGESIVFKNNLEVEVELSHVNSDKNNNIIVTYQGCAEGKYCYPKIVKSL